MIEKKLKIFKKYISKTVPKLYVFCGFDRKNKYDLDFWINDIIDLLERIRILMKYNSIPYIMKFNKYNDCEFKTLYNLFSSWGTPIIFKKQSFNEYHKGNKHLIKFSKQYPEIAEKYFDLKFGEVSS